MDPGFCEVVLLGQLGFRIAGRQATAPRFAVARTDLHVAHQRREHTAQRGGLRRVKPDERYGEDLSAHSCSLDDPTRGPENVRVCKVRRNRKVNLCELFSGKI